MRQPAVLIWCARLCALVCALALPACGDATDGDLYAQTVDAADTQQDAPAADVCTDADGDGLTTCGGDCDDTDPGAHPGAPLRDTPRPDGSWDIDCDGSETPESAALVPTKCGVTKQDPSCIGTAPGWVDAVPACGQPGIWLLACGGVSGQHADCAYEARVQRCR